MKKSTKSKASKSAKRSPRANRIEKNGVVRPYAGVTLKLWEIADRLAAKGTIVRADLLAAADKAGIEAGTASTQYGHWRKFHGITGRAKVAARKPAKKAARKAAPKAPRAPKPPVAPAPAAR